MVAGWKTFHSDLITPPLIILLASFELDEALIKGAKLWLSLQLLLELEQPLGARGVRGVGLIIWTQITRGKNPESTSGSTDEVENNLPPMDYSLLTFHRQENRLANQIGWFSNMHWSSSPLQICLSQISWDGDLSLLLHFSRSETASNKGNFCTNWLHWHW